MHLTIFFSFSVIYESSPKVYAICIRKNAMDLKALPRKTYTCLISYTFGHRTCDHYRSMKRDEFFILNDAFMIRAVPTEGRYKIFEHVCRTLHIWHGLYMFNTFLSREMEPSTCKTCRGYKNMWDFRQKCSKIVYLPSRDSQLCLW